MSSPYLALNLASAFLIIGVSSQWVAIITGESLNIRLRLSSLSTSRLPVEEPIKTFTPHTSEGFIDLISSIFSLLEPI